MYGIISLNIHVQTLVQSSFLIITSCLIGMRVSLLIPKHFMLNTILQSPIRYASYNLIESHHPPISTSYLSDI